MSRRRPASGRAGSSGPASSAALRRRRPAAVELGITDVADLRSPPEVKRRGPGQVPDGVDVHLLPFHDVVPRGRRGTTRGHVSEDDARGARRRGRRGGRQPVHDGGVSAIPDAWRSATRCAPSHFAAGRRAADDRPLFCGQGPHRIHGGDGARGRWYPTGCDCRGFPAQQRCGAAAACAHPRVGARPIGNDPRWSRSPRRG